MEGERGRNRREQEGPGGGSLHRAGILSGARRRPSEPEPTLSGEPHAPLRARHGQEAVAHQVNNLKLPPDLVFFFLGDNVYWQGSRDLYKARFDDMYDPLIRECRAHVALGNHDLKGCRAVQEYEQWESCFTELRTSLTADLKARYQRQGMSKEEATTRAEAEALAETSGELAVEAVRARKANCLPGDATAYETLPPGSCNAEAALSHAARPPVERRVRRLGAAGHRDGGAQPHVRPQPSARRGGKRVEQGEARGVRYFVTGGGGAPLYGIQRAGDDRWASAITMYRFVYMRLTATSAFYWTMDENGKVRDSGCFEKGSNVDYPLAPDFLFTDALPPRCAVDGSQPAVSRPGDRAEPAQKAGEDQAAGKPER